jgi:hypothetical protein
MKKVHLVTGDKIVMYSVTRETEMIDYDEL